MEMKYSKASGSLADTITSRAFIFETCLKKRKLLSFLSDSH